MKTKIEYLLISLVCMFITPLVVCADCSYERLAELSRIAGNVQFSYNYDATDAGIVFTVNSINVADDIYVKDNVYGTVSSGNEFNFKYTDAGNTIRYDIYSKDSNCYGEKLLSQYVTLPNYNSFSDFAECKDYPDFKYCQKWFNVENLTEGAFHNEFDKYIASLQSSSSFSNKSEEGLISNMIDIFNENQVLVIFVFVCLLLMPFLLWLKRRI